MNVKIETHDEVKDYYGKTLQSSSDLQSNCCTAAEPPDYIKEILKQIDRGSNKT